METTHSSSDALVKLLPGVRIGQVASPRLEGVPPGITHGDGVRIFWAHMGGFRASLPGFAAILSPGESGRAARFRFDTDRQLYIFAHGMLRMVLGRLLGLLPSRVAMERDGNGRPRLKTAGGRAPFSFNLSHSGEMAAVAVSASGSVGVDVEKTGRIPDAEGIVHQFFHRSEISRFQRVPPGRRQAWFYRAWTQKEAVVKAQGMGLSCPLDSFCTGQGSPWEFTPPPGWGYKNGATFGFEPLAGYTGAGAVLF